MYNYLYRPINKKKGSDKGWVQEPTKFDKSCTIVESRKLLCCLLKFFRHSSDFSWVPQKNKRLLLFNTILSNCFPNCIHSPAAFSCTLEIHSYVQRTFKLFCPELSAFNFSGTPFTYTRLNDWCSVHLILPLQKAQVGCWTSTQLLQYKGLSLSTCRYFSQTFHINCWWVWR